MHTETDWTILNNTDQAVFIERKRNTHARTALTSKSDSPHAFFNNKNASETTQVDLKSESYLFF